MFDFGSGELVVIGVVALVAIGPKELPGLLRTVGQMVGKVRRMAGDFQNQFNDAMREADMAEAQKLITDIKSDISGLSTGAGSMSPPIVMPSTSSETSAETVVTTEPTIALDPVAAPEPVAEFATASSDSHYDAAKATDHHADGGQGDHSSHDESKAAKTQAGAA